MILYNFDHKFDYLGTKLDKIRALDTTTMSDWAKNHWDNVEKTLVTQWKRTVNDYDNKGYDIDIMLIASQ